MHINCHKHKLYNLLLNSCKLDDIEYGYLCPLLEETGIYSGYSDLIRIAHQLSNQMQNVYFWNTQTLTSKKQSIVFKEYLQLLIVYTNCLQSHQILRKKIVSYNLRTKNCKEIILMCLIYILSYKIWKIKHWYPLISKLAFNCQELNIAKYFLKKSKLEFKMITMLILFLSK